MIFEYFLMLLGREGIKPDTMIKSFVNAALKNAEPVLPTVREREADQILSAVYDGSEVSCGLGLTDLDHTIWRWQRSQ